MPASACESVRASGRARAARGEAEFGPRWLRGWLCGYRRRCGEGDGVAEVFELGDEPACLAFGILAFGEVVVAEVLEHLAGAQEMPDELDQRVSDGDGCFVGPAAAGDRRYWAFFFFPPPHTPPRPTLIKQK